MNKEELKRELEDVDTIYVVGIARGTNPKWDKGIWRKFQLYYIRNGQLLKIFIDNEEKDKPAHWIPLTRVSIGTWKGGYFESSVLGMDRAFAIVYELGRWLFNDGYKFRYKFLSE